MRIASVIFVFLCISTKTTFANIPVVGASRDVAGQMKLSTASENRGAVGHGQKTPKEKAGGDDTLADQQKDPDAEGTKSNAALMAENAELKSLVAKMQEEMDDKPGFEPLPGSLGEEKCEKPLQQATQEVGAFVEQHGSQQQGSEQAPRCDEAWRHALFSTFSNNKMKVQSHKELNHVDHAAWAAQYPSGRNGFRALWSHCAMCLWSAFDANGDRHITMREWTTVGPKPGFPWSFKTFKEFVARAY